MHSTNGKLFYRADHLGSLLRPQSVHAARANHAAGDIDDTQLRDIEDQAIRDAVALQESVGLEIISDGEFRRENFWIDFFRNIEGVEIGAQLDASAFKDNATEKSGYIPKTVLVREKLGRPKPITVDDYRFLSSVTQNFAKITCPTPIRIHILGGRKAIDTAAYPSLDAMWADIVGVFRAEIADLEQAGCKYIQIDDPYLSLFVDAKMREMLSTLHGVSCEHLLDQYVEVINACHSERSAETCLALHICRGNARSSWMAAGGYQSIAEPVLAKLDVDTLLLEFDDERSGDFEPLSSVPAGRKVVLGLVSTKIGELEQAADVKRRIDDASRFVPYADLALSPQCGFASVVEGNKVTTEDQRNKLRMVVEVASDVWGNP